MSLDRKGAPAPTPGGFRLRLAAPLLAWLALVSAPAPVAAAEYDTAPTPGWVKAIPLDLDAAVPGDQIRDGVYYLLSDMQYLAASPAPTRYSRIALKATQTAGLDAAAHLEIDFDPAYQQLTLHSLDLVRDGRRSDRLRDADIRVIQREKELEYRIYDGRKTATIFLTDVRVGDVVDYSFSVRGQNPVFNGAIFGGSSMQWDVPVRADHTRLLIPEGRQVVVQSRNGVADPVQSAKDGFREYAWLQSDVRPLRSEQATPGWYSQHAAAEWSEYRQWADVVAWALPLYSTAASPGREVEAEIAAIAGKHASPAQRTAAVLAFVQSEIRYLGVEVGVGSHRPNPPALVLQRRFGDCKDKTLLMLAMLHRLGIQAHAALVNTEAGRGLRDGLPSPTAFDHVLVKARVDGRDYWLDPTRGTQFGGLDRLFQPDFGVALVVSPAANALEDMRPADQAVPRRALHAQFDAREGLDAPARLTVRTTVEFAEAESLRARLANDPREQVQKDYLNFYASYYGTIRVRAPLEIEDDLAANRIVTVEHYEIDDFWATDAATGRRTAAVHAADMYEVLREPPEPNRNAPLAISHPLDVSLTTEILLHEAWQVEDGELVVRDDAFVADRSMKGSEGGRRIVLVDRYRSLADHVAAEAMPTYVARLDEARDQLGYELTWTPAGAQTEAAGFNWTVALVALLLLAVYVTAAIAVYRHDPPGPSWPVDPTLQGIGGWLILPAIGVLVTPLRVLVEMGTNIDAYALSSWNLLSTPGSEAYHALWVPLLLFELAANLGILVLSVLLLVMFFQRRRAVPRLYILLMLGSLGFMAVDFGLASLIPAASGALTLDEWGSLVRALIGAMIWTPYFLVSRRVKSTFTCARARTGAREPPPLPVASVADG